MSRQASPRPTYDLEREHGPLVAGVDEVGRGPLAGPVVAAVVLLDPDRIPDGIDDSKRLSAARRAALYEAIRATAQVAVGQASVEEIDRLNILQASFLAMRRAVEALPAMPRYLLVDGKLLPPWPYDCRAVVGGDGLCLSIAAASIIAKVTRDRLMATLHDDHPHYGWASNMGYGTADHLRALTRFGATPHHRRSFAPVARVMISAS